MAKTTQVPDRAYLSTKELDALARSHTELLSELWILRDRVAILEHLLTEAKVIDAGAIDDYTPPPELAEALEKERDALVARVAGAGHRKVLDLQQLRKQP